MSMDVRSLKGGTDLRGTALGEHPALTPEIAARLGGAFAFWLRQRGFDHPRIALGRDSRLSGETLLDACALGCLQAGALVETYGLCTTPALYRSLITEGFACDGAVMVAASILPSEWNGLKLFTKAGPLESAEMDEILEIAASDMPLQGGSSPIQKREFMPVYCQMIRDRISRGLDTDVQKPLLGLHVVVDAGSGAGGFYASLLEEMGAWVEGSRLLKPDGRFPGHSPDPGNAEALSSVSDVVVSVGADLGVFFDTDCVRAAIVDSAGRAIGRNRLIALTSAILLDRKPGATIVTDSVTSSGLNRFIMEWGGEHYRYKRGYRNVISEAIRLNEAGIDCPLAIETSGHAAFRENHFLDDGMYLTTVLICEAMRLKQEGKELSSLIADLKEPAESAEIRLDITGEDFHAAGLAAIEKVMDHAAFAPGWHIAPDNREGVRISCDLDGEMDSGWFLLRLSRRDPVLPLNLESDVKGGAAVMARALLHVLEGSEEIDLSKLQHYIEEKAR